MYSAPDKLPKRFSIIQNVCDFSRHPLEMSNSLSTDVSDSSVAVRERARHLVIKRAEDWTLNPGTKVDSDLSGSETHFSFLIPEFSLLIRNICDPRGETRVCGFLRRRVLLFSTEHAFLRRPRTFGFGGLRSPRAGYHSLSPMKKLAAGDY